MHDLTVLADEQFIKAAIEAIERAKRTIDIATFKAEISHTPRGRILMQFWEQLAAKQDEGVSVRILLNETAPASYTPASNRYAFRWFKDQGFDLKRLSGNRCCHAKMLIVDDARAIIGSHNLSIRSCRNNFEMSIQIDARGVISRLRDEFNKAFESGTRR